MLLSALALLCCGLVSGQRTSEVAKVVVPRCCPPGLALSDVRFGDTLLPADVQALCTTVFDERAWKPKIFIHGYLEPGRVPSHWQLEYSRVPKCAKLRATPWMFGMGLLNHSGRMRVTTNHFPLASNRFCADAGVVLVCQPDVLKCCPPGFRVEDGHCFNDNNHTEIILNQSIPLHRLLSSEDGTAGLGFPTCAKGCQLGMVGDLDEVSYNKDGVLELGTARLGPDEWCGGQLRNSNNTSVFACVSRDSSWKKKEAKKNETMFFLDELLLEADQRDAELLACKKKEEVRKHKEEKVLIHLNEILEVRKRAEQSVNQKLQENLKASKNLRVVLHNGVITIQEGTQNESWIARNKWSVVGWVFSGLSGLLCARIHKSKRQKSQTDSNQTELKSVVSPLPAQNKL